MVKNESISIVHNICNFKPPLCYLCAILCAISGKKSGTVLRLLCVTFVQSFVHLVVKNQRTYPCNTYIPNS